MQSFGFVFWVCADFVGALRIAYVIGSAPKFVHLGAGGCVKHPNESTANAGRRHQSAVQADGDASDGGLVGDQFDGFLFGVTQIHNLIIEQSISDGFFYEYNKSNIYYTYQLHLHVCC